MPTTPRRSPSLYLLGTPNGVVETASAGTALLRRHHIELLVLEAPTEFRNELNAYFADQRPIGTLRLLRPTQPHDGRQGPWLGPLLRYAKRARIRVRTLDAASARPSAREQGLARQLRRLPHRPTLFVCGELHAAKTVYRFPFAARFYFAVRNWSLRALGSQGLVPAARLLANRCVSYRLIALDGGWQYNFGLRRLTPQRALVQAGMRSGAIIRCVDSSYDFYVVRKAFTASPAIG